MNGQITTEETYHAPNILRHYTHAKEKHPYFCDRLLPDWPTSKIKSRISVNLGCARSRIKAGVRDHNLMWNEIADCEVWEATEAMANGDTTHAVEELYDVIAVLLRTVDVLEGRQKLGKTETKDKKKVNCVKCGESIPISKAEDWEVSGSTRRFICQSCAAEEAI